MKNKTAECHSKKACQTYDGKHYSLLSKRPGRFPGIAGNARNHNNDGKFHKSHKILNQI